MTSKVKISKTRSLQLWPMLFGLITALGCFTVNAQNPQPTSLLSTGGASDEVIDEVTDKSAEDFRDESSLITVQLAERLSLAASMSANFTQQTVDRTLRVLQENTGKLWVNPDAKFRIETSAPAEQTLVSNGIDFWVYDADLEQVIVSRLEADISQVPVLLLGGNFETLKASYAVSYYEDELGQNYVLTPLSSDSLFTSLSISFDETVPSRIAILDALGQRTLISLSEVNTEKDIEPILFSFLPPSGTDVIDDRP